LANHYGLILIHCKDFDFFSRSEYAWGSYEYSFYFAYAAYDGLYWCMKAVYLTPISIALDPNIKETEAHLIISYDILCEEN